MAALAVPVGMALFLAAQFSQAEEALTDAPLRAFAPVGQLEIQDRIQVTISSTRSVPSISLYSNGAFSSVITQVSLSEGDTVDDGSILYVDGDTSIFAVATLTPLYRSLSHGDEGEDVLMLQSWLADLLPYEIGADGSYGPETESAVRDIFGEHGQSGLDLRQTIWLPEVGRQVESLEVVPGAAPPSLAAPVLEVAGEFDEFFFSDQEGNEFEIPPNYLLEIGETTVTPDDTDALIAAFATEFEAQDESSRSLEESMQTRQLFAVAMESNSTTVLGVPVGAVVRSGGGDCVFVNGDRAALRSVAVEVLGGEFGLVHLSDDVQLAEQEILINPLSVLDNPSCG